MDHLVVSLLNTGTNAVDPLETALGTARWWSSLGLGLPPADAKPRYDAALAAAVRAWRNALIEVIAAGESALPMGFRGDGADAILFEIAHAVRIAVANGDLKRIRRCSGQGCGRYFYDDTKNGSRRWCSLRCMERARVPRRRTISR